MTPQDDEGQTGTACSAAGPQPAAMEHKGNTCPTVPFLVSVVADPLFWLPADRKPALTSAWHWVLCRAWMTAASAKAACRAVLSHEPRSAQHLQTDSFTWTRAIYQRGSYQDWQPHHSRVVSYHQISWYAAVLCLVVARLSPPVEHPVHNLQVFCKALQLVLISVIAAGLEHSARRYVARLIPARSDGG